MISQFQNLMTKCEAVIPSNWISSALVLALLMTGVVIGLFWYLKRRVKKQYFTLWMAAWIGYAVYLLTAVGQLKFPSQPLLEGLGLCGIGLSSLFMCWGGLQLANKSYARRVAYAAAALVVIACFGAGLRVANPFWLKVVALGCAGGVGIYVGRLHLLGRGRSSDSKVLGAGIALWALYVALLPLLELSPLALAASHLLAAALAVLIAMAMVLEQGVTVAETNFGALFEAANDAVFLVDAWRLTIVKVNPAAEGLTKRPADELCGLPFGDICPSLDRRTANVRESEKLYRAALRPYEKILIQMANGGQAVCEGQVHVVQWQQRPVFQVTLRNVGEHAQLTEHIRRSERLSTVGRVVAGVAHELNNPLAIISCTSELLTRHNHMEGQLKKDLDCIKTQSERASRIVRDLLSYARPSEPNKTVVDINRVVSEVLEWQRDAFEEAGIQVQACLAENLPPTMADRVQVEQILANLLNNAIDAVKTKPVHERKGQSQPLSIAQLAAELNAPSSFRSIVVTTAEVPGFTRISVEDNGPGISADISGKIYDPFFTTKPAGRGTGLGLAICHTYVQEHGGKIWLESEAGLGARFFVDLPLVPCKFAAPVAEEPEVPIPAADPNHYRLLIVDDEPDIVCALGSILSELGYDIRSASDGEQAWDILSRENFDVILSDMRMPGLDGQALYQRIREARPSLARQIIFVTGDTVSTKTREFLDATGNLWLGKPFRINDVTNRVQEALQRQRPVGLNFATATN